MEGILMTSTSDNNGIAILMTVTHKELRNLFLNDEPVLLRATFPKAYLHSVPIPTLFVEKGSQGRIVAKGFCSFLLPTVGSSYMLARAGITEKQYYKQFKDWSYAWEFRNILPAQGSIFDLVQLVSEKKQFKPVANVPRGWCYVKL